MNVFVVNLARRPDRRARMERILPRELVASSTRPTGPGRSTAPRSSPPTSRGFGLFDWEIDSHNEWWNRPLKLGEIGCAVSHWLCWQRASDAARRRARWCSRTTSTLVPRHRGRARRAPRGADALDPDWDLVYLGRWVLEPDSDVRGHPGLVRPAYSYCTFGYMLSAAGLAKSSTSASSARSSPSTSCCRRSTCRTRARTSAGATRRGLNAYAFDPPLVTQLPKDVAGSDTEATADYSEPRSAPRSRAQRAVIAAEVRNASPSTGR